MSTSLPPINDPSLIERLAKLSAHQPHTRHWGEGGAPAYTNALILEQSLHLLQHAHNPVAWRPWGLEAFEEAAERGLPLFVSVGYRACHWCQQMALESFDDLELAALLNERFVPIKVDRDERPEVDAALIDVAQVTTGKAGWPLSVVLSPERLPLFASTYLPLRDGERGVEVGLLSYLKVLAEHWSDERLQSQAVPALEALQRYALQPPSEGLSPVWLELAAQAWVERFDPDWGGFSAAPKFPRPVALEALLRAWHQSGEQAAREAVEVTFERMACGGIYDHVGGGFARYSLDNRWWVPRFEKMLSDNAQLASLALELLQATKRPFYAKVARDVLRFMVHELKGSRGAFASDISAYSMTPSGELKEGYFYTWTQAELAQVLSPEELVWVCETFGVIDGEEARAPLNVESPEARAEPSPFKAHIEGGRSVLHLYEPLTDEEERYWAPLRAKLYEVRSRRLKPLLNDAVLCSANALAMSAFARAAAVLGEREWLRHAQDIADFIVAALWDHHNHKLYRLWRAGERGRAEGSLEDYMSLAVGLLDLFEVTGAARYLSFAREVYGAAEPLFDPERGGFFRSDEGRRELLPFDEKPKVDGAEPSGNALAALAALKLSQLTGEPHYRAQANSTLRVLAPLMESQPMSCPKGLSALAAWFEGQPSLTFVQLPEGSEPLAHPLSLALWGEFAPYSARLTTRLISAETKALAPALKAQPEQCTAPRSARCGVDGSALEVLSSPQALRASLRAHR